MFIRKGAFKNTSQAVNVFFPEWNVPKDNAVKFITSDFKKLKKNPNKQKNNNKNTFQKTSDLKRSKVKILPQIKIYT